MRERIRFEGELRDLELESTPFDPKIRWLQTILNRAEGESLATDGLYGKNTRDALLRFQNKYFLSQYPIKIQHDGSLTPETETGLVQRALNFILDIVLTITGSKDNSTVTAIKSFQKKYNELNKQREPDGVIGPKSRGIMILALNNVRIFNPITRTSGIRQDQIRRNVDNPNVGQFGWVRTENAQPKFHQGLDLLASVGTPVYAVKNGVVTYAANTRNDYGWVVIIDHLNGMTTHYAHLLAESVVQKDANVKATMKIGQAGRTGNADKVPIAEAHVHFELRQDNEEVDPTNFLLSSSPPGHYVPYPTR